MFVVGAALGDVPMNKLCLQKRSKTSWGIRIPLGDRGGCDFPLWKDECAVIIAHVHLNLD